MGRRGDHRVRHLARWVATPILLLAAAVVFAAAYLRDVRLLTGAAVGALGAGIVAALVFDVELIRSRRAHGAERVAQARAYAAMYAEHLRLMAGPPAPPTRQTILSDAVPEPAPTREAAGSDPVLVHQGSQDAGPADAVPAVEAGAKPDEAQPAAAVAREVDAPVAEHTPEPSEEAGDAAESDGAKPIPISAARAGSNDRDAEQAEDIWASGEEPTVVDLSAWEIRARIEAEERRKHEAAKADSGAEHPRREEAPDAGSTPCDTPPSTMQTGTLAHGKPARTRKSRAKAARKGA